MSLTTEDLLVGVSQPNSLISRVEALEAKYNEMFNRVSPSAPLSMINPDMGDITAGTLSLGNGQALGLGFTGLFQSAEQFEWPVGSGDYWNFGGFNNDVLQVGIDAITGKLLLGGGAVIGDSDGLTFEALDVYTDINRLKWVTPDGLMVASVLGFPSGTTPDRSGATYINATAESSGEGNAEISLSTGRTNTVNSFNMIRINDFFGDTYSPLFPMFMYTDRFGNRGTLHVGDYAGYAPYASNAGEVDVYTRTIFGGSLGATGFAHLLHKGEIFNGKGTSGTARIRVYFGGTLISDTGAVTIANGVRMSYGVDSVVTNSSASTQRTQTYINYHVAGDLSTLTGPSAGRNFITAAINTANDAIFKVTCTLSASHASFTHAVNGTEMLGPYYA